MKSINKSSLRKVISRHGKDFPCTLHKLIISVRGSDNGLSFISNGIDVTSKFMINKPLFDVFYNAAKTLELVDGDYFFTPKYSNLSSVIINNDVFFKLRIARGYSIVELSDLANVDRSTIRQLEQKVPFDPSISTVLKCSLFFRKPFHELISEKYKSKLLSIILSDFVIKEYISEEKAKDILNNETKI
jgi:transcriptional regulator with XRE-family HTH domain